MRDHRKICSKHYFDVVLKGGGANASLFFKLCVCVCKFELLFFFCSWRRADLIFSNIILCKKICLPKCVVEKKMDSLVYLCVCVNTKILPFFSPWDEMDNFYR